jgi:glutamate-1-semialdehyde 2,1-aminomutase
MTSNDQLFHRALQTAPGGVHSPVRAFHGVGGTPVFMASATGPTITDVSGRPYIDFCLSFGPLILGHRDPAVLRAAQAALEDGWSFGTCEPYSLALAEWIIACVPWVERLRFVSSGTEAVMSALRVARAATGRSVVLKFEGCYHGHADPLLVKAGSGLAGEVASSSAGVSSDAIAHTVVAPLDDESAFDAVVDRTGADLAAVIVEGVPANFGLLPPRREWLHHIAARTRAAGALFVLDEVITGFRLARDGAAAHYGLTPDLVCYGKVMGGGFPAAAYGGRADLMNLVAPAGPVYQAGTLSANPVGMRAGLTTLEEMTTRDGWSVLERRTRHFTEALRSRLDAAGLPIDVVDLASIFWLRRRTNGDVRRIDRIPAGQAAWFARFFHEALARGVYLPPSPYEVCFVSLAHDPDTLARAADALVDAAVHAERP